MRTALGASRLRILRQLLIETMLLGLVASAVAILFAKLGLDVLRSSLPAEVAQHVEGWNNLRLDARLLIWIPALAIGTGLLVGLVPALGASRRIVSMDAFTFIAASLLLGLLPRGSVPSGTARARSRSDVDSALTRKLFRCLSRSGCDIEMIHIANFTRDMTEDTARMLARAFVTNPLHVAAFGANQLARNEAFFRTGLDVMKGHKFVALSESRIVGFIHWVAAPDCQLSSSQKLKLTPAMIRGFGFRPALRVVTWLSTWSKHDPQEPHVHLGPIGVAPDVQGKRVGALLMARYREFLDQHGYVGYLETDRAENVTFYERFGFTPTTSIQVLGVPNYLMRRKPHRPSSAREAMRH